MGTVASVHVLDPAPVGVVHDAIDAVFAELERLEALFSTFRPSSQISQVNRGERHLLDCDPEVIDVFDAITWLESASDGAFQVRRPGTAQVDPAGFVKGWATERASRRLDDAGLRHWYVSVGGDLQTRGTGPHGTPWRIAVADPADPGEILGVLRLVDGAVATSGTAERGHHLWDGRTCDGTPAHGLRAVTVVGPHLTWADAFATTAYALGADGPAWVRQFAGYEVVVIA